MSQTRLTSTLDLPSCDFSARTRRWSVPRPQFDPPTPMMAKRSRSLAPRTAPEAWEAIAAAPTPAAARRKSRRVKSEVAMEVLLELDQVELRFDAQNPSGPFLTRWGKNQGEALRIRGRESEI